MTASTSNTDQCVCLSSSAMLHSLALPSLIVSAESLSFKSSTSAHCSSLLVSSHLPGWQHRSYDRVCVSRLIPTRYCSQLTLLFLFRSAIVLHLRRSHHPAHPGTRWLCLCVSDTYIRPCKSLALSCNAGCLTRCPHRSSTLQIGQPRI